MPSQVTDIKEFLEIARRKDAKGTSSAPFTVRNPFNQVPLATQDLSSSSRGHIVPLSARIKRSPHPNGVKNKEQIKFKIRAKRHLHTLVLSDTSKADKIKQSLPPGTFFGPSSLIQPAASSMRMVRFVWGEEQQLDMDFPSW
ncbi:uncharacterized protein HMPREF1541_06615 [Cyphellophora europaea CBS 101466]|uniref:Uncharacterized protein n=1 Tax=Cyphellophora europaea (strain CBS 101466) TaxID=1220924 RepID=W2RS66_CYPE1|nr:uncharacterized protein HMPREF1541_06615 [Cyphellophora europaea CBS 101466]ETN38578.1 hypothetical protein HMPREF1541_06615 [Cyphellophora europaea CBS 101466]